MLLAPSRTKYRRQHRGRMKGTAQRGNALAFGEYGLQALEPCWMEARQIESARIALTRFMKRGGKVWTRVALLHEGRRKVSRLNERRKQVAEYSAGEAMRERKELRLKLFNLRLQQQRGEVKNNRVFAQTRKDIARLQHRLTQLEGEE